jgi:hypothetical protein
MSLPDSLDTARAQIKENSKRYAESPLGPSPRGGRYGGGEPTRTPIATSGGGRHAKPQREGDHKMQEIALDTMDKTGKDITRSSSYTPKHARPTTPVDRAGDTSRRPGV